MKYLFIFFLLYSFSCFSQKNRVVKKETAHINIADTLCHLNFLKQQIAHNDVYSALIVVPTIIEADSYRIIIRSEYLHKYLISLDSTMSDSTIYVNKVLDIIYKKQVFTLNPFEFITLIKDGKYIVLDKINPYSKEIKELGLSKFLNKRFYDQLVIVRGNNTSYQTIFNKDYYKINEYNFNYLIEALFDYNFNYENLFFDSGKGFTKIGCPK